MDIFNFEDFTDKHLCNCGDGGDGGGGGNSDGVDDGDLAGAAPAQGSAPGTGGPGSEGPGGDTDFNFHDEVIGNFDNITAEQEAEGNAQALAGEFESNVTNADLADEDFNQNFGFTADTGGVQGTAGYQSTGFVDGLQHSFKSLNNTIQSEVPLATMLGTVGLGINLIGNLLSSLDPVTGTDVDDRGVTFNIHESGNISYDTVEDAPDFQELDFSGDGIDRRPVAQRRAAAEDEENVLSTTVQEEDQEDFLNVNSSLGIPGSLNTRQNTLF